MEIFSFALSRALYLQLLFFAWIFASHFCVRIRSRRFMSFMALLLPRLLAAPVRSPSFSWTVVYFQPHILFRIVFLSLSLSDRSFIIRLCILAVLLFYRNENGEGRNCYLYFFFLVVLFSVQRCGRASCFVSLSSSSFFFL